MKKVENLCAREYIYRLEKVSGVFQGIGEVFTATENEF